jgi:hypothetical protein
MVLPQESRSQIFRKQDVTVDGMTLFPPEKTSIGQGFPIQGGKVFEQRVVFFRLVDSAVDSKALVHSSAHPARS